MHPKSKRVAGRKRHGRHRHHRRHRFATPHEHAQAVVELQRQYAHAKRIYHEIGRRLMAAKSGA